jgi:pimeloyl-ACP methyl ester carboxylesterase
MRMELWVWLLLPLVALVPVSMLVERLRRKPVPPGTLPWAPELPVRYADIGGVRARYVRTGSGPALVLLHTLRTQLDIYQKVIPELARQFTVYAVDYPGHGWSDIPQADYTPEVLTRFVAEFLERLEIDNVVVAGVSIGASIGLLLAAAKNPRVRGVVAINPYDYGKRGIERANGVARILFTVAPITVLGETVMRLRNPTIERKVLEGGVAFPSALPESFVTEVFRVGERPGHYEAFLNLIRRMPLWRRAREAYGRIQVPVLLVYGDRDWSRETERRANLRDIPGARLVVVSEGGHFLPLDRPEAVVEHIQAFTRQLHTPMPSG